MKLAGLADECGRDLAEFAGVGYDDDLTGLLDHLAIDETFFSFEGGGAAVGVKACDAEEDLVEIDIIKKVEGSTAGEREGPGPGNDAASENGADAGLIAELHADVDGVGDDLDFVAMTEAAADVSGGGAGGEANGFAGLDELCCGQADAALFSGVALLAGEKRAVVAERFIEQGLDERGAAVGAPDEAAVLKPGQVAADAGRRTAGFSQNLVDGGAAGAQEELDDFLRSAAY